MYSLRPVAGRSGPSCVEQAMDPGMAVIEAATHYRGPVFDGRGLRRKAQDLLSKDKA